MSFTVLTVLTVGTTSVLTASAPNAATAKVDIDIDRGTDRDKDEDRGKDPGSLEQVLNPIHRNPDRVDRHSIVVKYHQRTDPHLTVSGIARRAARVSRGSAQRIVGRWVSVRSASSPSHALAALRSDPAVAHAHFDRLRAAHADVSRGAASQGSRDPAFDRYQQYLRETMDFPQAWRRSTGGGVRVAVIDSGVDRSHPDLGHVLRGHDFVQQDSRPDDPNGHGTFVAGIIAAKRANGRGIAGASRATILPVRVLNARGYGRDSDVARGIRWATDHGADVINMSLGGPGSSRLLTRATKYAERHEVLVVASTGNSGGTRAIYPAALQRVVAVGATDSRDRLAWFSQRGSWIDLVAPGYRIASTLPGNRYGLGTGTSFSAPLVSGAAALLVDQHPGWSPSQMRARLLASAADAGPIGPDPSTGFGVVDVDGLLGGDASVWAAPQLVAKGFTPGDAISLDGHTEARSHPEGTSTWFKFEGTSRRADLMVRTDDKPTGVLRNDIALSVYDNDLRLIAHVNRRTGATPEEFSLRVDGVVYIEVRNHRPTRLAGNVVVKLNSSPTGGAATEGSGPRPLIIDADPQPNATGVDRTAAFKLSLGRDVRNSSVDNHSVRLIDGRTGARVAIQTVYDSATNLVVVTPNVALAPAREYALILVGIKTPAGSTLATQWLGIRTRS